MNPMRRAAAAAIALTAFAALAACGEDTADEAATDAPALLPAAEGTTAYPLTLETPWGETVLEERPERIAVLGGLGELEAALALGVSPVVTPWESDDWSWLPAHADQFAEAEVISPWADSLAAESILAAEPDLIVAISYGNLEDDFDRLSQIGPVLGPAEPGVADWQSALRSLGEALDLAEAAATVAAETEQVVTDAVADHPQYDGKTVGIVINRGQEGGLEFVNRSGSPAEAILTELGFAPHPNADRFSDDDWGDVAMENLGLVDADGLVVARHGGDGTIEEASAWLEGSELYASLDAVRNERVAYIDADPATGALDIAWAFSYPNALAIPWTVGELNTAFAGVFDA